MKENKYQKDRIYCTSCVVDGFIVLVFRSTFLMSIRNVEPGEALYDKDQLATKGVFTCVAVLIFLQDDTLFLAHVDSTIFDADSDEPLVEIQKIIEHVILLLDVNFKDIMIETVFLIGGVQNSDYTKLNASLSTY
jgi:hypothetical protein